LTGAQKLLNGSWQSSVRLARRDEPRVRNAGL
jgi:hypothetical protein